MFFVPFNQALYATQHSRIDPPFGNAVAAMRKPALPQCGKAVIVSGMAEDGKHPGATPAAADPSVQDPSVQDLAKRLMDLWQEQMAAIAADPDLMRQMAQMMAASPFPAMMQGIMQGVLAATAKSPVGSAETGGQNPYEWWKAENGPKPSAQTPSPQTGTPAAAPASQPGGGDLAELRRNLAGLEARLAELGAAGREIADAAGKSKPDKPKPAKSRSEKFGRSPRKPAKPVAGPAGGGGESGTGGAGGGAAG
jgi:hypothetical protein